jgi:hypothetical protein
MLALAEDKVLPRDHQVTCLSAQCH